jgi:hypothetical protein
VPGSYTNSIANARHIGGSGASFVGIGTPASGVPDIAVEVVAGAADGAIGSPGIVGAGWL